MADSFAHKFAIVEGVHLSRGLIAAHCCHQATGSTKLIGLAWKAAVKRLPPIEVNTSQSVERYYEQFELLLKRLDGALVIPCTLRGNIIANSSRNRHFVLAEPYLKEQSDLDKLELMRRQNALAHYFQPRFRVQDNAHCFPLLAKARFGHSGEGQRLIKSKSDLKGLCSPGQYYLEPLLPRECEEFSLTIINSKRRLSWMCLRRVKQECGRTVEAEKNIPDEVTRIAEDIARRLECDRIYNVQFAWTANKAIIYDLNPRFGHSELYRTCFGFNYVGEFLNNPSLPLTDKLKLTESDAYDLISTLP